MPDTALAPRSLVGANPTEPATRGRTPEWKATEEALWSSVVAATNPLDRELTSRAYVDHHLTIPDTNPPA